MFINLEFDSSVSSAPAGFTTQIQQAANMLDAAFRDNITVNIKVGWGEINGNTIQPDPKFGNTTNYALGHVNNGISISYASLRTDLAAGSKSSSDFTALAFLPTNNTSFPNQNSFFVASAQERALGLMVPSDATVDGAIGFGTDWTSNWVGGALHELTHAMGRIFGGSDWIMNLFRYSSPGTYQWTGGASAYFSIDGGNTPLAYFGTNTDFGDFDPTLTPNDAFDERIGSQSLSAVDITLMDTIGFDASAAPTNHLTNDFNDGGSSDVLWRNGSEVDVWFMHNGHVTTDNVVGSLSTAWQFAGAGDFTGTGTGDVLWRNAASGEVDTWLITDGHITGGSAVGHASSAWQSLGTGDFNGDGTRDVLWRNTGGEVDTWLMSNGQVSGGTALGSVSTAWRFGGIGDFDRNGASDIAWQNSATGEVDTWLIANDRLTGGGAIGNASSVWQPIGIGDVNNDGTSDLLWRNTATGEVDDWLMQNGQVVGGTTLGFVSTAWQLASVGNFNSEGSCDLLWRNTATGAVDLWVPHNGQYGDHLLGPVATTWQIQPITSA
jgi:FG-GAP repeat